MGKSRPIVIGKIEFATVGAAKKHVQRLVAQYANGAIANQADTEFLSDLLELHPSCAGKVGAGIRAFRFEKNPVYPRTRTIFIDRIDGSPTDFSWVKCLDGETPERLKRAAMRNAVVDQIIEFKREVFSHGRVVCPLTGQELSWGFCHVDHCAPHTFDKLVDEWLVSENLTLDSVEISPSRDSSFSRTLTNDAQSQSWRKFHNERKQLRLLAPRANLSDAKLNQEE
jgi:hypothetical protein